MEIKLAPAYKVRRGECCGGCVHWQPDEGTTGRCYGTCAQPNTHVFERYRPREAAVCRGYQFVGVWTALGSG